MIGSISGSTARLDFNPTDATELPESMVKARLQIAAIKTEQEMMAMQGRELARLMEPSKGMILDARA